MGKEIRAFTFKPNGKYVVCFFDLMGTTDRLVRDINYAINSAWLVSTILKTKYNDLIIRSFTDNYLIAFKMQNSASDIYNFNRLLQALSHCMFALLNYGIQGRGCISIGDMYIDENILLGEPLVRAYEGEGSANYSRIIIEEDVLKGIYGNNEVTLSYKDLFFKDDYTTFNYLILQNPKKIDLYRLIDQLKSEKNNVSSNVQIKYDLLINYIDNYIKYNFKVSQG